MTLAELRALLAAATPGPWKMGDEPTWMPDGWVISASQWRDSGGICTPVTANAYGENNAALIVAMHAALPALLDVAEAAALYQESVMAKRQLHDWDQSVQREKPADFDRLVLAMNLKGARGEALFAALARLDAALCERPKDAP